MSNFLYWPFRLSVAARLCWLLSLLAYPWQSVAADSPATSTRPNILLFLADDMGIGDSSAYQDWSGNDPSVQLSTPAMERLARMGVRSIDAHSPHSRCTTTRYALLSGRYCWRTRLKHWVLFGVQGDPLLDEPRLTLPEFLRQAGYQTGMVGKWHLGLKYHRQDGSVANGWDDADLTKPLADGPLDHGFDFFFGISRSHGTSGPDGNQRNSAQQAIGPGWIEGRTIIGATGDGKRLDGSYRLNEIGQVLDRQAFSFLKDVSSTSAPFFLYFASPANHSPYTPSRQIGTLPVAGESRFVDGMPTNSQRLDFIYQNDVHIARLLDYLSTTDDPRRPGRPLLENTFFVFASDNGAEIPSKTATGPLRSHKGSVYEGGHRIPFLAMWQLGGIGDGNSETPGATRQGLLGLNDMYATWAEALNSPLPSVSGQIRGAEDSVSQLGVLRGDSSARRPPLFSNDHKEASNKLADERAWVAVHSQSTALPGNWKLLLDHRFAFEGKTFPQELYNLTDDPLEQNNLVASPDAQAVREDLLRQAALASGDDGQSREN